MQIVNYVRATVFKSSNAALELARQNQQYSQLAKNIVSAKQSNALKNLILSHSDQKKHNEFSYQVNKYTSILNALSSFENISSKPTGSDFGKAVKGLRANEKVYECFLPLNKGDKIILNPINERLI